MRYDIASIVAFIITILSICLSLFLWEQAGLGITEEKPGAIVVMLVVAAFAVVIFINQLTSICYLGHVVPRGGKKRLCESFCQRCHKHLMIREHEWQGCKCEFCGKVRNTGHSLVGCQCKHCHTMFHKWSSWRYLKRTSCIQVRTCSRCKAKEHSDELHKWSGWTYDSANSCSETNRCLHCGKSEHRESHKWSGWTYESTNSCSETNRCLHCGKSEHRESHDWERRSSSAGLGGSGFSDVMDETFVCRRCGKEETSTFSFF